MNADVRALDHAARTDLRRRGVVAVQSGQDRAHNERGEFCWLV